MFSKPLLDFGRDRCCVFSCPAEQVVELAIPGAKTERICLEDRPHGQVEESCDCG